MSTTFDVCPKVKDKIGGRAPLVDVSVSVQHLIDVKAEAAGCRHPGVVPVHNIPMHGFLHAVHLAFDQHLPLELSPDDVWLTIAQGFAAHVNANAERLRKRFVQHEGKAEIVVVRNEFTKGSPSNDWPGAFGEFSDKIGEYIGKKRDLLVSNFSTTGPAEKAASEIVLMDAMQSYFQYTCVTCCGIPTITLTGTAEDWRDLRTRAHNLLEIDESLALWIKSLDDVLGQFCAAYAGDADPEFWNSFYKIGGGSGGPYVTGAINVFFPYLRPYRGTPQRNDVAVKWSSGVGWQGGGPCPGDIPIGLSQVPFKWDYYGQIYPMSFIGGFVGVHQDDARTVRPAIGWAIADAAEAAK